MSGRSPRTGKRPYASVLLLCTACLLLSSTACDNGGGSGNTNTIEADASRSVSAVFSVQWHEPDDATVDRSAAPSSGLRALSDCGTLGIGTVTAEVYDEAGNILAAGGPWECSAGKGTIYGIPAGAASRVFIILGKDGQGNTIYQGQSDQRNEDIQAGGVIDFGVIDAFPFVPKLVSPANPTVSLPVEPIVLDWDEPLGNPNIAEYRLLVSENQGDFSNAFEVTLDFPPFTFEGVSENKGYYWKVKARDSLGNEGADSETWLFGTADCLFNILPTDIAVPRAGGSSNFTVTTQSGCSWNATTETGWIRLISPSGTGSGSVTFAVDETNPGPGPRSGIITAAGQTVNVSQNALWFLDSDGDGFGNPSQPVEAATQPVHYVLDNRDCDDSNPNINPGKPEVCNDIDDDCDGRIDEGLQTSTYYRDADGDGYGAGSGVQDCRQPTGYVTISGDCNDSNPNIHPGVSEVCNGVDENCNGRIDEGVLLAFYRDSDDDGFGNPEAPQQACAAPAGYVSNNDDCDDENRSIHPGAAEICNDIDDNCTGGIDEGLPTSTFYRDADGDLYGAGTAIQDCAQPAGHVSNNDDCDDENRSIHPGAEEICNDIDDNCAGGIDEGLPTSTFYPDADGDGYGAGPGIQDCAQPAGHVTNGTDCNDSNSSVNPGAQEVCNQIDDDCDGEVDEFVCPF